MVLREEAGLRERVEGRDDRRRRGGGGGEVLKEEGSEGRGWSEGLTGGGGGGGGEEGLGARCVYMGLSEGRSLGRDSILWRGQDWEAGVSKGCRR